MSYIQGVLMAVPNDKRAAFVAHAKGAWDIFKDYGALSVRECWGDDVPDGQTTSFPMAVKMQPGESVVFSWVEWPDKETYQAAGAAMETDPRFAELGELPFDGMRMMWGGFTPVFSDG